MDEQSAIQLCLEHKDPAGFEFLVQKYRREALFHAIALLGNQEDALDACQESFTKAFLAMPRLEKLPLFYPWFYSILRNHCLNVIARRNTAARYREATARQEPVFDVIIPGKALEEREDHARVQKALAELSPEHREILVMKYFQEHSYEEIAEMLQIPRGTVMSRLYHARLSLREAIQKLDDSIAPKHQKQEILT